MAFGRLQGTPHVSLSNPYRNNISPRFFYTQVGDWWLGIWVSYPIWTQDKLQDMKSACIFIWLLDGFEGWVILGNSRMETRMIDPADFTLKSITLTMKPLPKWVYNYSTACLRTLVHPLGKKKKKKKNLFEKSVTTLDKEWIRMWIIEMAADLWLGIREIVPQKCRSDRMGGVKFRGGSENK